MWRDGRPIAGRGYYILVTDCRDFYNVGIMDPIIATNHRIILDKLEGGRVRRNCRYCNERSICLIVAPKVGSMLEGDIHFRNLKNKSKKPTRTAQERAPWILDATLSLVDQKIALRLIHTVNKQELRTTTS